MCNFWELSGTSQEKRRKILCKEKTCLCLCLCLQLHTMASIMPARVLGVSLGQLFFLFSFFIDSLFPVYDAWIVAMPLLCFFVFCFLFFAFFILRFFQALLFFVCVGFVQIAHFTTIGLPDKAPIHQSCYRLSAPLQTLVQAILDFDDVYIPSLPRSAETINSRILTGNTCVASNTLQRL